MEESAERTGRIRDLVWRACNAGIQVDELGVIAPINRKILDGAGGECAAEFGGGGVDDTLFLTRNFDLLRYLAGLEGHVETAFDGHIDVDVGRDCGWKPARETVSE
jgi:hypothetical protein